MKIKMKITCEQMPNQIEGIAKGKRIYFRARHDFYSLRLMTHSNDFDGIVIDERSFDGAGWWNKKKMLKMCKRAIYRAHKRGSFR